MRHKATWHVGRIAISAALALGFAISWAVQAGEIIQSEPIDYTAEPPALTPPLIGFDGFDTEGNTRRLTDVILSWDLGLKVTLESAGMLCGIGGLVCDGDYTWQFTGYDQAFKGLGPFIDLSQKTGFTDTGEDPDNVNELDFYSNSSTDDFTNLGDFVGTGPVGMVQNIWGTLLNGVTTTRQRLAGEPGDWDDSDYISSTGTISLTYKWEENTVPLPTTIALVGLGLAGMRVQQRRAK